MTKQEAQEETPVQLTKRAIAQLKKAIVREKVDKNSGVRINLIDAGNGFRYDIQFESKLQEDDLVSTQGGLQVFITQSSERYLNGTQLDFIEAPKGSGFIFHRPGMPRAKM